jgi:hypothetical protein
VKAVLTTLSWLFFQQFNTYNAFFFLHKKQVLNWQCVPWPWCGDFNINYSNDNSRKDLLNSLLASFNFFSTINFPTRISNKSCTSIDNIYINIDLYEFSVYPFINGLSDHDAHVITLKNITISAPKQIYHIRRDVNNYTINQFMLQLSYEIWEDVFFWNYC